MTDPAHPSPFDIPDVVAQLRQARERWRTAQQRARDPGGRELPSRDALAQIVQALRGALFPMRLGPPDLRQQSEDYYVGHTLDIALHALLAQVRLELRYDARQQSLRDGVSADEAEVDARANAVLRDFAASLASIRTLLDTDVQAAFRGDDRHRAEGCRRATGWSW